MSKTEEEEKEEEEVVIEEPTLYESARRLKGGGTGGGGKGGTEGGGGGLHTSAVVLDANIQLCKTRRVPEGSCVIQDYDGGSCSIQPSAEEVTAQSKASIRKNSFSLLDPEGATIPSLIDLSQRDYDVNAPVSSGLLQGQELLKALESSSSALVD